MVLLEAGSGPSRGADGSITTRKRYTYLEALDLSLNGSVHEDTRENEVENLIGTTMSARETSTVIAVITLAESSSRKRKIRHRANYAKLFVRVSPGSYNGMTDSFAEAFLPFASAIWTSRLGTAWPGLT